MRGVPNLGVLGLVKQGGLERPGNEDRPSLENVRSILENLLLRETGLGGILFENLERMELYFIQDDRTEGLLAKEGWPSQPLPPLLRKKQASAVRHLFRLAAGLDSRDLGDPRILDELQASLDRSNVDAPRFLPLRELFHKALDLGRTIREKTEISFGFGRRRKSATVSPPAPPPSRKEEWARILSPIENPTEGLTRRRDALPWAEEMVEGEVLSWVESVTTVPMDWMLRELKRGWKLLDEAVKESKASKEEAVLIPVEPRRKKAPAPPKRKPRSPDHSGKKARRARKQST